MWKAVILVLATSALARADDPVVPVVPQNCSSEAVQSLNWNNTELFGNWLEVARNPIGNAKACVYFSVGLLPDNTTLSINATHSSSNSSLYQDIDESARIPLVVNATTGYNVTFQQENSADPTVFIKLLQYVNSTYVVGCGYTNALDNSTSYGFILARTNYTDSGIQSANNAASPLYSNFQNNTYGSILQQGCYKSSAGHTLPLISGVLGLVLLLLKAQ